MRREISTEQLRRDSTGLVHGLAAGISFTLVDDGRLVATIVSRRAGIWRTGLEAAAVLAELGPDMLWAEESRGRCLHDDLRDPWAHVH